jgi:Flp pilus assembly protein TadB
MPFFIAAILVLATLAIAGLCYVWMQSTRASQRRVEAQNQRIVELLEEQSGLLKKISERPSS